LKIKELFEENPGKNVLLSGNEAFARGIFEAGVEFSANYPGTPLNEVADSLKYLSETSENFTFDYSINEKVALESSIGASWANKRSIVMFKHLGLNVAADPLHTFPYSGINGGMIILCGSDPGILSSTNAQDNRLYSYHTKIPIIEPGTVQECKNYIKEGIKLSEEFKIPVYVHITARLCHGHGIVKYDKIESNRGEGKFEKNPDRYINTLKRAIKNQKKYFDKIQSLRKNKEIAERFSLIKKFKNQNTNDDQISGIGIITSGICYAYTIEACEMLKINPPILKLGLLYPLNQSIIQKFIKENNLKTVLIVEELEPFIERNVKEIVWNINSDLREVVIHGKDFIPSVGELEVSTIIEFLSKFFPNSNNYLLKEIKDKEKALDEILKNLPLRQPTFCPGCQYRPIFYALKKVIDDLQKTKGIETIFAGDIGCYTLVESYPFELLDWVISMGSGIGIANGMSQFLKKNQKLIAYIGDSTFFHTGIQPLLNAIKNDLDLTILIFNNYWTAMTGHQETLSTPRDLIMRYGSKSKIDLRGINISKFLKDLNIPKLEIIDSLNIEHLRKVFYKILMDSGLRVILINQECALERKHRTKRSKSERELGEKIETFYTISKSCPKCNECIEYYGCPAIDVSSEEKEDSFYYIDEEKCLPNICEGMCRRICENNMIRKTIIYHNLRKTEEEEE
jgi:indolepyruvate ferredoxin oxidoreductase alpha subunit